MVQSTAKIDDYEQVLIHDPSVSYWVKKQLKVSREIDPVDALGDAELLVEALKNRLELLTGQYEV